MISIFTTFRREICIILMIINLDYLLNSILSRLSHSAFRGVQLERSHIFIWQFHERPCFYNLLINFRKNGAEISLIRLSFNFKNSGLLHSILHISTQKVSFHQLLQLKVKENHINNEYSDIKLLIQLVQIKLCLVMMCCNIVGVFKALAIVKMILQGPYSVV